MSLWDDAAAAFRGHLNAVDVTQSVMVVTTFNQEIFSGNLYLNPTPATKFYFVTTIPAFEVFTERQLFTKWLGRCSRRGFTRLETMGSIRKKELVTIGDLYSYLSNYCKAISYFLNHILNDPDFLCKARIVGVLQQNGWSYVSCTGCSRKLDNYDTSHRCSRCVSPNVTGVIRFRAEMAVEDGKDSATFVVFDTDMSKLTKTESATVALDEFNGVGGPELPRCIEELAGNQYVFHISVTPFNITSNHLTFTGSAVTEDILLDPLTEVAIDRDKRGRRTTENKAEGVVEV
ncbi:hypothetical protein Bca52824_006416 [Brassica carinata]|uniref:Replication factor A C-terminal domain-containing protein n=1 Tax=Brassica carinata TaxID=52824 RepID=A0A8X7W4D6_BRACI|nr:hypothetical protein Bca52824_006416 [Brassica carinata]